MITFPAVNLSFNINKIAFTVFGIDIYYYAICIVCGIILAVILAYKTKENYGIKFDFLFETLIYAVIIGLIGARLYYVLFNLEFYKQNPLKILNIRDGGLAIYGMLIFDIIFIILRCKAYKYNSLDFFDYFVPFVVLAQCIGRWGNFFNCEAYGTETANFLRMGIVTNEGYKEVHPAFLYESITNLLIYIILRKKQKNRNYKGEIFYLYLFLYSGARMLIESIRIDSLMLKNFRISQILSIAIFVIFGIMLLKNFVKNLYKRYNSSKLMKKVNQKQF